MSPAEMRYFFIYFSVYLSVACLLFTQLDRRVYTVSKNAPMLSGIEQNYTDWFWCHLAEIFKIDRAIQFQSWCIFWDTV